MKTIQEQPIKGPSMSIIKNLFQVCLSILYMYVACYILLGAVARAESMAQTVIEQAYLEINENDGDVSLGEQCQALKDIGSRYLEPSELAAALSACKSMAPNKPTALSAKEIK